MVDQEVIHKLRMLSGREREVLKLFCEGNNHETIGKILFIGKNTVKTHMGNIYIKLGLEHLPSSARRMIIYQTYCPAVHEFAEEPVKQKPVNPEPVKPEPVDAQPVNPEAVEPEPVIPEPEEPNPVEPEPVVPEPVVPEPEPEPVPDEIIDMVNEDEHALMVVKPIINIPPIEDEQKQKSKEEEEKEKEEEKKVKQIEGKVAKPKKHFWRWVLFFIIIALLVFGGMQVYTWARGFITGIVQPLSVQNIPAMVPTGNQVQPTTQLTSIPTKEAVVVPTNTEIPSTPIPTHAPAPKITLPFNENFSNGINSPWKVEFGKWFVADSGASITINDVYDNVGSIVIDDPTLTNYILRVTVYTPHIFAASQGQYGVVVRYGADRDQNIIFYTDKNGNSKWAYAPSLSDLPFYLPGITDKMIDTGNSTVKLEITVSGNTFTAKVDGKKIDQFSMTGYENGGVALITACGSIGSCPSFSDLSIEPIN